MLLFHICLISACRKLEAPANGNASNYLNSRAPVDANSSFNCDDKYILSGAATITCQANGSWTNKEPECKRCKKCLIILLLLFYTSLFHFYLISACRKLKNPANGVTSSYLDSRAPVNATSTFNCSKGYALIGAAMVTCQANGKWTSKEPKCKCKKPWQCILLLYMSLFHSLLLSVCHKLSAPANGTASNYTDMEAPVGANSTFSCDDRYALSGTTTVMCQANGYWSNKEPECKCKKFWNLLANKHVIVPLFLAFSLP